MRHRAPRAQAPLRAQAITVQLVLEAEQLAVLADLIAVRLAASGPTLLGSTSDPSSSPTVYTVATLAAELGRTQRAIRGAIARGELRARRSGRRYVIAAASARAWATPEGHLSQQSRVDLLARPSRSRVGGVMAAALAALDTTEYSDAENEKRPGGARTPRGRQQEVES
jgi:hypothetical protein